jgi:tetratricopeptide (TPR) repeat protein
MRIIKTISCAGLMLASLVSLADNTGVRLFESGMYEVAKIYFLKQLQTSSTPEEQAEACFYLGETCLQFNQPDSAKLYYQKGAELLPTYPFNQIGLEKLALKGITEKNALKAADASFKEIIKVNKKDIRLPLAVAQAYIYAGNTEKTNSYIKDAKKVDNKSGLPYMLEADILHRQEKYGEAAARYDMANYFEADLIGAYLKSARLYIAINRDAALEKLHTAKEKAADFPGVYLLLGDLYSKMPGKGAEAAANYSRFIEAGYYGTEHLLQYAGILYFDKQYEKMLPIVRSIVQKQSDNLVANRLLAYGLSKTERGEESITAIRNFVTTTPEERLIVLDYLTYAEQLEELKHYAEAATNYKKVIQKDETKKPLLKNIADLYGKNQQSDSAICYYNHYLDFTGQPDATIYYQIGRHYYNMAESDSSETNIINYRNADSVFTLVTELAPASYLGYFWRARVNAMLDPETTLGLAVPFYEKVIEITLEQPERNKRELIESYRYFGYFYYVQAEEITRKHNNNAKFAKEEYLKAKDYFSKVLELDPNDPTATKAIEGMENIK